MIFNSLNQRIFFIFFLSSLALFTLVYFWDILFPFLLGLFFAYLLDPFVIFLEKKNYFSLNRNRIVVLIFLFFISTFIYLTSLLFHYLQPEHFLSFIQNIPEYNSLIQKKYLDFFQKIQEYDLPINPEMILQKLLFQTQNFFKNFVFSLNTFFKHILNSFIFLIIVPMSTFYFLKDKYKILKIIKSYLRYSKKLQIKKIFQEINLKIGGYIKGQLLISLIVTIIVALILLFFQPLRPYIFLLAIIAGITNIIPYIGPIIGSIPSIGLALNYYPIDTVLLITLFFIIFNTIIGFIITPKIMASTTNIHPLLVIITITIGSSIYGIVGMLLAIPLTIIIKILLKLIFENYIHKI